MRDFFFLFAGILCLLLDVLIIAGGIAAVYWWSQIAAVMA